jgi:hypothetical protein
MGRALWCARSLSAASGQRRAGHAPGLGRASPRSRPRGEAAPRWGFMPGAVTASDRSIRVEEAREGRRCRCTLNMRSWGSISEDPDAVQRLTKCNGPHCATFSHCYISLFIIWGSIGICDCLLVL